MIAYDFAHIEARPELTLADVNNDLYAKDMRRFFEQWTMLDANSSVATDELQIVDNEDTTNSTIAIVDFPIEDFFAVPFTHHIRILEKFFR